MTDTTFAVPASDDAPRWPVRYLLFIAGLGGLLYGIDIGIIAGALRCRACALEAAISASNMRFARKLRVQAAQLCTISQRNDVITRYCVD